MEVEAIEGVAEGEPGAQVARLPSWAKRATEYLNAIELKDIALHPVVVAGGGAADRGDLPPERLIEGAEIGRALILEDLLQCGLEPPLGRGGKPSGDGGRP